MPRIIRRYGGPRDWRKRALTEAFALYATTDPHIWSAVGEDPNAPDAVVGQKLFYTVPSKMRDFVAQANSGAHAALCAGDLLESGGDFAYYKAIWDQLTVPAMDVPGNHDYSIAPATTDGLLMQYVADGLGRGSAPINGGSRLTYSIGLEGNGVAVRFLLVDTNVRRDEGLANGRLTADAKDWIATELAAAPEDIVFIVTHHGPHHYNLGWFVEQDALDLQAIVEGDLAARPGRTIRALFGHRHAVGAGLTEYRNMGQFIGLNVPVLLESVSAKFPRIYVFPNGRIHWDHGMATYTA